jgi:hypothetical protein
MNDCVENLQLQLSWNCWPMTIIHLIGILFIVIHLRLPEIQSNCVKTTDSINYLSTNCMTVHSMLSVLLTFYLCQLSLSGDYISLASRHHIHIIILKNIFFFWLSIWDDQNHSQTVWMQREYWSLVVHSMVVQIVNVISL